MKSVISIFLIFIMMIANLFNSITAESADLAPAEPGFEEVELSVAEKDLLTTVFETETAWLASLQLENGAIPMTSTLNGTVTMNPYFADIAALALLDKAEKYAENVKAYMDWHFSHLNTKENDYNRMDATIYDYNITLENGKVVKEESKGSYDSTDSYAATFLMVLNKYYEKTGDAEYIIENGADIARVAEAMLHTLSVGLTYAKPDYKVMYLMDNCEVYEGCVSAANLLSVIATEISNYRITQTKCTYAADWIKSTVEKKMWNADGKYYDSAVFKNGKAAFEFSWNEFYPSATAQLFPIVHGLIGADTVRAKELYDTFSESYHWQSFDIPSEFCWGSNVYAAALVGDVESVVEYMNNYAPGMLLHSYPLYNADIARVAMAAYTLLNTEN